MLAERLLRRCASAQFHERAIFPGHRVAFAKRGRDNSGKATLLHVADDDSVFAHGVVYRLAHADLTRLDAIEGVGSGYQRIETEVTISNQSECSLTVATYMAEPAHIDSALKPFDWYLELIVAGARRNTLPIEYCEWLADHAVIQDPCPQRATRREALEILAGLKQPQPPG